MSSRRFFTTFAAMVLVEALTIAFSGSIAFATTSTCPAPGSTVRGGLVVTGNCTTTGVTISGGVTILGGGHLTIYASKGLKEGTLKAVASFVKRGKTVSVVRTKVFGDNDKLIAEVTTTHVPAK